MSPTASQETQTSNLFKVCGTCAEKLAKLNNCFLRQVRTFTGVRKNLIKIILIDILSGLNLLNTAKVKSRNKG